MKKIIIAGFAVFAASVATGLIYADEGIIEPQIVEPQVAEPQIVEEITESPPTVPVPAPAPAPLEPPVCETCNPAQHTVIITYHQPVWIEPCFDYGFIGYHHPFGVVYPCLPVCW